MKITRRIIYWTGALILVFLTLWLGYVREPAKKDAQEKIVPVEVETVNTGSIEETIELTAWIKAIAVVDVTSKVPGRIESLMVVASEGKLIPVEEGLLIKKGQQLATIDHDVYLAQVAAAQANLKAREVELADAQREKKRILALYEGGSATQQNRDKAVTAAELAAARLSLAQADLRLAEINLRESTICSPIDGIVTAKHIDEGNLIRAGDIIATIADMKTVKTVVAAAEKYGAEITVGTPVKIKIDAFPERVFDANVYSVYPALDAETHTIQVEIRLNNDELLLKQGMFARVTLITERKDYVIVIPRDVVLGGKIDEPYVYVVNNNIAHKRLVKVGSVQAERCEIAEGLKSGDTLVVNGMNYLTDGMSVEVVQIEDIR